MTIAEQAKLLLGAVKAWAETNRGTAYVASDAAHVVRQLLDRPGAAQVAILWQTEDPRGEHSELGKVDREFKLIISRGRGMKLDTGENLTEGSAGGRPMFDLVEELREVVRGVRQEDADPEAQLPDYRGAGPFEVQGYILDAVEVRFSLAAQIPIQE